MGLYLKLFTTSDISTQNYANAFFDILESYCLVLSKIGLHEPLKSLFTRHSAVEFWTYEEDGCYNIETCKMEGKAGWVF
jgi:hypothetical protein